MTTFDSIEIVPRRVTNWTRAVAVAIAAVALIALSFILGRATMDHSVRTTISPTVVQPAFGAVDPAVGNPFAACHGARHPC